MDLVHIAPRSTLKLEGDTPAFRERRAPRYRSGAIIAGRYMLGAPIGTGGMGVVHRARDLETGTVVAIKLAARNWDQHELALRMRAEAQLEIALQHPGIVRAHDYGRTAHGDGFIVMELLEGESLRDLLAIRSRLPADQAVRLLLPIADALTFVHARSVVHRDVKPDNIFLAATEHGLAPKLIDFGIAKRIGVTCGTYAGAVVGSPGYMAPEQAYPRSDVDERADVWGLCLVLYEAIAGASALHLPDVPTLRPHDALTFTGEPTLQAMGCCERLFRIVQRGLALEREHRFATMREVAQAMTEWLCSQPRRRRFVGYPMVA